MSVLVAGVGNVLRRDDGFGVRAAEAFQASGPPAEVRVIDVGIGGIHLVQELMGEVDALIVFDAVEMGRPPGTVVVVEPEVEDVASLPLFERHDALADMHYATPERAFMLARALGSLPERAWVIGCQPLDADSLGEGLTPAVAGAVPVAMDEARNLLAGMGLNWGPGGGGA